MGMRESFPSNLSGSAKQQSFRDSDPSPYPSRRQSARKFLYHVSPSSDPISTSKPHYYSYKRGENRTTTHRPKPIQSNEKGKIGLRNVFGRHTSHYPYLPTFFVFSPSVFHISFLLTSILTFYASCLSYIDR